MLILTFTLSGVLLSIPYVTQTSPDSLMILQTRLALSTCIDYSTGNLLSHTLSTLDTKPVALQQIQSLEDSIYWQNGWLLVNL